MFFGLREMEYLGYTVYGGKLSVSTKKVEAVKEWLVPKTQHEVRTFVQFCSIYAKLIHHFSDMSAPFTYLLRKTHPQKIEMTPICMDAFDILKLRLIFAPCLVLPEVSSDATSTMATYASVVGIAFVLLQDQRGGLETTSYSARKLKSDERGNSCSAYDLEALDVGEVVNYARLFHFHIKVISFKH
jgi:hypothetical protein